MSESEKTLELIREGYYNTDRPSNLIIKELVEVIKLLDNKLNQNKEDMLQCEGCGGIKLIYTVPK